MSGFTVRKPTTAEIQNADPKRVVYVHMTSDMEWQPHNGDVAAAEQELRDNINRGYDLHEKESRDLGSLQARGQCREESYVAGRNGPAQATSVAMQQASQQ